MTQRSYPQPYFPPYCARAAGEWLWITPRQEPLTRKAKIRRSPPALKWPSIQEQ
jgi:hypothetical protein